MDKFGSKEPKQGPTSAEEAHRRFTDMLKGPEAERHDAWYVRRSDPDLGKLSVTNYLDFCNVRHPEGLPNEEVMLAILDRGYSLLAVAASDLPGAPSYLICRPADVRKDTIASHALDMAQIDPASTEMTVVGISGPQRGMVLTPDQAPAVQAMLS